MTTKAPTKPQWEQPQYAIKGFVQFRANVVEGELVKRRHSLPVGLVARRDLTRYYAAMRWNQERMRLTNEEIEQVRTAIAGKDFDQPEWVDQIPALVETKWGAAATVTIKLVGRSRVELLAVLDLAQQG